MEHLGLRMVAGGNLYATHQCRTCGEKLWEQWRENRRKYFVTRDGRRHLKSRCNLTPTPSNGEEQ